MSVMAMSVRGVTSPSMLKAVRLSRTATLKDVHPRYASFPIRPARLSPTRCQNSTTPSAPAFSIMSSIREASATSIMGGLGTWTSHERGEDLLQVGAPFFLRLRRDRVPLDLPEAVDEFRQEPVPVRGGHVRRGRPDLVVGHRDDLLEGPGPTRAPSFVCRYWAISLFFLNSFVSPNFSTNKMRVSRFSSPATASS